MKLALMTPAIGSRNVGDALIEDAVRRMVPAESYERFTLRRRLNPEEMRALNACDAVVICGSNVYQESLPAALDELFLAELKRPLIPLGMGSSAAPGMIPVMNAADARVLRALHERCVTASVRDAVTLRFLKSIGVENARLTGCPVLFHALRRPEVKIGDTGPVTVSLRQSFLHGAEPLEKRQEPLIEALCLAHKPTLITQGPADLRQARRYVWRHQLDHLYDDEMSGMPHVWFAQNQAWTGGFRLHYGMLSLSYGRPAWFIGHDSRVEGFCQLMGLPCPDIRTATIDDVLAWGPERMGDFDGFSARWDGLAAEMRAVLEANGLPCRIGEAEHGEKKKPRVLCMVDTRRWAYDFSARSLESRLAHMYDFHFRYSSDRPVVRPEPYDLALIFSWGEQAQRKRGFDPNRVIGYVSSHRWQYPGKYGPLSAHDFIWRNLSQTGTVLTTSQRLWKLLCGERARVFHAPNGYDARRFYRTGARSGPLHIGAAGTLADAVKGFGDILKPAAEGYECIVAEGKMEHSAMNTFYNRLDVIAITSAHEGEPLTLIEAMAAGCFPVCTDVGIVPELVEHQVNGYIVRERSVAAFREAFAWCTDHLEQVRAAGERNAELLRHLREWEKIIPTLEKRLAETLDWASQPRFLLTTHLPESHHAIRQLRRLLARYRQTLTLAKPEDLTCVDLAEDVRRHHEAKLPWQMLPGACYHLRLSDARGPHGLGWQTLDASLAEALLPAPPERWPLLRRLCGIIRRRLSHWLNP